MSDPDAVFFRWRIDGGESGPGLTSALRVGEAARAAMQRGLTFFGLRAFPDDFHHGTPNLDPASWLPEDADGDGLIDHISCFWAPGLPLELLPAFAHGGSILLKGLGAWRLTPTRMGAFGPPALVGPARRWLSATPFVTPREVRRPAGRGKAIRQDGSRDFAAQLQNELLNRGLPKSELVAPYDPSARNRRDNRPLAYVLGTKNRRADANAQVGFVVLEFLEPVCGPIALGFGRNFGLGQFEAADEWTLADGF